MHFLLEDYHCVKLTISYAQNYLPGVEDAIRKELQVPNHWKLKAQLVFGRPTKDVGEREWSPSAPVDERVRVVAQL